MKFLYRLLPLLLLLLLISCTTSSPRNRGSLKGAMGKSRDDYKEERTVPDEEDIPRDSSAEDRDQAGESEPPTGNAAAEPSEPVSLMVLGRGGMGFRGGPYFFPRFNTELMIGETMGQGRWEVFLFGGFSHMTTRSDHEVSASLKSDVFILDAGVEGRFYPFPRLTFLSPWIAARLGGMILFWEFENDLTAGSDTISSDSLSGLLLGTGVGIDFIRSEMFRVGFSVIPDAYLLGEETSQGFSNDYFNTQGVLRWSVEGGGRF